MRGLGQEIKRRGIFDFCRERADIILLQETHSTPKIENQWELEWGNKILFSHGESNARGVAILTNKIDVKPIKIEKDCDGRLLITELKIEGHIYTVANVYGPNKDCPDFFRKLSERLEEFNENKIIIGDFNVTLNDDLDRYTSTRNKTVHIPTKIKSRQVIKGIQEEYFLTDIWRERNIDTLCFSWSKRNPGLIASRIDYALVSQGLSESVINSTYIPAYRTDHAAFFLAIENSKNERGRGYWKFNCALLQNADFVKEINNLCEEHRTLEAHPCTVWENFKTKVKKKAIEHGRKQTSQNKLIISQLMEKIDDLEKQLPLPQAQDEILIQSKIELDQKIDEHTRGIIFRSRAKWVELGEKSSKYFFNLEKARYNAKTSTILLDEEGTEYTNDQDILEMERRYYQELYDIDNTVKFDLKNIYGVTVSEVEFNKQGRDLEIHEIKVAINELNNGKTPGEDGLPIEFYKFFCSKIIHMLYNMFECSYCEEYIPPSISKGVLNLIPKPGKDSRFVKNLRPITLLNCDYKIMEKIIANRMSTAMSEIIHNDQKGFMPGRRIASNIRKIFDLMQFCENNEIEGIILSLDYMKCFDLISFDAIIGALDFFGFNTWIQNYVCHIKLFFKFV